MDKIIVVCKIKPGMFRDSLVAIYDDETSEVIFEYYNDEMAFDPREFVGLTKDEALDLYHRKDIAYLQSY